VTRRGSAQRGVGDKCQAFAREVVDPTRMRKHWPCVNGSCVCALRNQRIGSHPKGITCADAVAPRETVACLFAGQQMKAGDVRLRAQTSETAIFDGCGRNSVERGDRSELERPRREASREVPSEVTPQIDPAVQGRVVSSRCDKCSRTQNLCQLKPERAELYVGRFRSGRGEVTPIF
jgi:hypothetical protein